VRGRTALALAVAGLAAGLSGSAAAARPASAIANAKLESRQAADPAAVVSSVGAAGTWLTWAVPGTERVANVCCFGRDWNRRGCSLAEEGGGWGSSDRWRDPGAPRVLRVLAQVSKGRLVRLIAVGAACPVDGGGRRVVELDGVDPERSLDLVERWSTAAAPERVRQAALAALAYHASPSAAERLARIGKSSADSERRGQALFWLAQTGDPRAAGWIEDVIARDPDSSVREQAVFALSQVAGAVPRLVRLLRETDHPDVRRQALFWLAQSEDPRPVGGQWSSRCSSLRRNRSRRLRKSHSTERP
jgi:hypothetical protein